MDEKEVRDHDSLSLSFRVQMRRRTKEQSAILQLSTAKRATGEETTEKCIHIHLSHYKTMIIPRTRLLKATTERKSLDIKETFEDLNIFTFPQIFFVFVLFLSLLIFFPEFHI